MRRSKLFLLAVPLVLGGCALLLPTPVTIATYALDGVTYLATGKTMSDHALSFVMQRDCSMMRIISQTEICYQAPSSLTAFAFERGEPWPRTLGDWEYEGMEVATLTGAIEVAAPPGGDAEVHRVAPSARPTLAEDRAPVWEYAGMIGSGAWIPAPELSLIVDTPVERSTAATRPIPPTDL